MRFRNSRQLRAPRRATLQSHVPDKVTSIFWWMTRKQEVRSYPFEDRYRQTL
jgi:hypothetical protein